MTPDGISSKFFRSISVDTHTSSNKSSPTKTMGTGSVSPDGCVTFFPSPSSKASQKLEERICDSPTTTASSSTIPDLSTRIYLGRTSSFLRVADLDMDHNTSIATEDSEERQPHCHHAATDPPPGVQHDPNEKWVALNLDDGSHAPIAPLAIDRLANLGLVTSMNHSMWTPDSKTERLLKKGCPSWMKETFNPGCVRLPDAVAEENEVLVWSGKFKHGLYGSDLPAIRAAGIVNMSAKSLMELLVDSSRVKEYNKLSLGRTDLITFQDNLAMEGPFGHSITKVMKSETKPPMVRKNLVFVSILHAKELIDGTGYLIVTRAVHHPEEEGISNSVKSEILMGVNLIRKIEGAEESRCLMINVNHIRTPMVPLMVAKRIGVSSAIGFMNDIRSIC